MKAWAIVKEGTVSNYACDPPQSSLHGARILLIATSEKEARKITRLSGETIQQVEIKILAKLKRRRVR